MPIEQNGFVVKKKKVAQVNAIPPWADPANFGGMVGNLAQPTTAAQQWTTAAQQWGANPEWDNAPMPDIMLYHTIPAPPIGFIVDETAAVGLDGTIHTGQAIPPNPVVAWNDPAIQAIKKYTHNDIIGRKDIAMKEPNSEPQWYDKIGDYPKKQDEDTPPSARIDVVTLKEFPKSLNGDWMWNNPFWVRNESYDAFVGYCLYCSKTQKWMHHLETGRVYNGHYASLDWLKKNGYILMEAQYSNHWHKKTECFEYWYGDNPGKMEICLAPKGTEKNFPICDITGKRYHCATFLHVITIDGQIIVGPEAAKVTPEIKACFCCHHWFKEPLISMWDEGNNETKPKPYCVKCKGKIMDKSVIRGFDDSNFLPEMYDIFTAKLQGKEYRAVKPRLFGVELEVGFNAAKERSEVALNVWDTLGRDFCYIKHDGSITKEAFDDGYKVKNKMKAGFEIVSAPAGIDVHRERWKALANVKDFKILRAWDADSCGLHVHVNRQSLTWLQIGRMLVFMNHPSNRYFVEVVAGRNSNFYTRYIKKEFTDCGVVDESKYMALRTNKPLTIEFRIFRSTVNYRHIMRDIEFTEAVCDFCAPCANSLKDITDYRKFIIFVAERKTSYPMLAQWLSTIELIAKKPLANPKYVTESPLEEALSDVVVEQLKGVMKAVADPETPLDKILTGKDNAKIDKAAGGEFLNMEPEQQETDADGEPL